MRWAEPNQNHATDDEHDDELADGAPGIGRPVGPVRLPEVFVGGEGLVRGAADVLGTLLHEAAHARARSRPRHQGHESAGALAQRAIQGPGGGGRDRGGEGPAERLVPDHPATTTRARYVEVIAELGRVLRLHRAVEITGGKATKPSPPPCVCGCGRKIRVSPTVLAAGPITCGVCGVDFAPDRPDPDEGDGEGDGDDWGQRPVRCGHPAG